MPTWNNYQLEWNDDASLQAFLRSPACYLQCLKVFGFQDINRPGALFTVISSIAISSFSTGRMVTIFTLSFTYPASKENCQEIIQLQGLWVNKSLSRLGIRFHQAWVQGPQMGYNGQLVEKAVVVQAWPNTQPLTLFSAGDKDEWT